jgi:hypothetical protein
MLMLKMTPAAAATSVIRQKRRDSPWEKIGVSGQSCNRTAQNR